MGESFFTSHQDQDPKTMTNQDHARSMIFFPLIPAKAEYSTFTANNHSIYHSDPLGGFGGGGSSCLSLGQAAILTKQELGMGIGMGMGMGMGVGMGVGL